MRAGRKLGRSKFRALNISEDDSALISSLPEEFQTALSGTGTYRAQAIALGVAVGTIKSRLNRARTALVAAREADKS